VKPVTLSPDARAEAKRILDAAARRILAESVDKPKVKAS
jgi:hypothetical protein